MASVEMKTQLARRMEDSAGVIFKPEAVLYEALTEGQKKAARFLRDEYLSALEKTALSKQTTLGVLDVTESVLGEKPLRGGTSVQGVRISNSTTWLRIVKRSDLPKTQSAFFQGHIRDPWCYIYGNKIICVPSSIRLVDVLYLKATGTISADSEPDLDDDFYNLILLGAEEELWSSVENKKRSDAAHDRFIIEAAVFNERLNPPKDTGMETESTDGQGNGRRR